MEESFFLKNDQYKLFGVLHSPPEKNGYGIVFCYPFAEARIRVHRVYVNLARELMRLGFCVLRFDYMGDGDSDGSFVNASIESRIADIIKATQILKEKTGIEKIGLLGVRFGGTMACVVADEIPKLEHVVMIEPVVNGKDFLYKNLRVNLSTQVAAYKKIQFTRDQLIEKIYNNEVVNVGGYGLHKKLYNDLGEINLLERKPCFVPKILILATFTKGKKKRVDKNIENLVKFYREEKKTIDYFCVKCDPFWELLKNYYPVAPEPFSVITSWFKKSISGQN